MVDFFKWTIGDNQNMNNFVLDKLTIVLCNNYCNPNFKNSHIY